LRTSQANLTSTERAKKPDIKNAFFCRYGSHEPGKEHVYTKLGDLTRFIRSVIANHKEGTTDDVHYNNIVADGWLDEGWEGELSKNTIRNRVHKSIKNLRQRLHIKYKLNKLATPQPVPGHPGLFTGNVNRNVARRNRPQLLSGAIPNDDTRARPSLLSGALPKDANSVLRFSRQVVSGRLQL